MRSAFREFRHGSSALRRNRRARRPRGDTPIDRATADGQATLSLSAALTGGGAPLTGGLRWRIFAAQPDADGRACADRRIEPRPADPDHAARRLCRACRASALPARPGGDARTARFAPNKLPLAAGGLRIDGTLADAPIDPSKLSLAIYVPEGRNPQGKLVYAKAKAGEIIGLPEGAYHIVSTYLDTVGGRFLASVAPLRASRQRPRRRRLCHPIRSSPPTSRSPGQAHRRDASPPLRHADAQARQQAGGGGARQHDLHRADAGRRRHPRADRRFSLAGPGRGRICRHRAARRQDLSGDLRGPVGYGPRRRSCCTRERPEPASDRQTPARPGDRGRQRMQTFFVQIKCALGRTYEVASALAEAEIASEIYSIAGNSTFSPNSMSRATSTSAISSATRCREFRASSTPARSSPSRLSERRSTDPTA